MMAVFDHLNPLASITPRFTEEQLQEIVEWFDENSKPLLKINEDEELTHVITIEQFEIYLGLRKIHRRSFHYPTYAELMKEVEILNMGTFRMLTKSQFIYLLDKWLLLPDMRHELAMAFGVFDSEKRGYLEIDIVRNIVMGFGEPYTDSEVQELLRDANVRGDGNVYYENFVDSMFVLAPELNDLEKEFLYEDPDDDPSVPPDHISEPFSLTPLISSMPILESTSTSKPILTESKTNLESLKIQLSTSKPALESSKPTLPTSKLTLDSSKPTLPTSN